MDKPKTKKTKPIPRRRQPFIYILKTPTPEAKVKSAAPAPEPRIVPVREPLVSAHPMFVACLRGYHRAVMWKRRMPRFLQWAISVDEKEAFNPDWGEDVKQAVKVKQPDKPKSKSGFSYDATNRAGTARRARQWEHMQTAKQYKKKERS